MLQVLRQERRNSRQTPFVPLRVPLASYDDPGQEFALHSRDRPLSLCERLGASTSETVSLREKAYTKSRLRQFWTQKSDRFGNRSIAFPKSARPTIWLTSIFSLMAADDFYRANKRPTDRAIREVLGEALFLIRFPSMHPQEFTNGPAKENILSAEVRI